MTLNEVLSWLLNATAEEISTVSLFLDLKRRQTVVNIGKAPATEVRDANLYSVLKHTPQDIGNGKLISNATGELYLSDVDGKRRYWPIDASQTARAAKAPQKFEYHAQTKWKNKAWAILRGADAPLSVAQLGELLGMRDRLGLKRVRMLLSEILKKPGSTLVRTGKPKHYRYSVRDA